jgi:hypothetical protein
LQDKIARALTPLLSGPDAAVCARDIVEALVTGAGEVRNVFALARHELPLEVPDVVAGVVAAIYVREAVDGSVEQRDDEELLGDAGVPSELVSEVLAELAELGKGRAA